MNVLQVIVILVLSLLLIESLLYMLINYLKKDFQWLLTKSDDRPNFSSPVLDKFFAGSFEPRLGWVRKQNTHGFDKGKNGPVKYTIDGVGSRNISGSNEDKQSPLIATFGDSYTFCRQVEDHQTWQAQMSPILKTHVMNFGVGNYGLDQALIRYNNTPLPDTVKIVIMGVVPETICRVHSYWKHYLEFGNTLAFKPRYKLEDGELILCENIIKNKDDFCNLPKYLDEVQKNDVFYQKKYRSHQFRHLYIFSFLKHAKHNTILLYYLLKRNTFRLLGMSDQKSENDPFAVIMNKNITDSHKMYEEKEYCALLKSIIVKFKQDAINRGHTPLLVIMPQLKDLESFKKGAIPYEHFYKSLKAELDVLDLTKSLLAEDYSQYYINDQYGGHFSEVGNSYVSDKIVEQIKV